MNKLRMLSRKIDLQHHIQYHQDQVEYYSEELEEVEANLKLLDQTEEE